MDENQEYKGCKKYIKMIKKIHKLFIKSINKKTISNIIEKDYDIKL